MACPSHCGGSQSASTSRPHCLGGFACILSDHPGLHLAGSSWAALLSSTPRPSAWEPNTSRCPGCLSTDPFARKHPTLVCLFLQWPALGASIRKPMSERADAKPPPPGLAQASSQAPQPSVLSSSPRRRSVPRNTFNGLSSDPTPSAIQLVGSATVPGSPASVPPVRERRSFSHSPADRAAADGYLQHGHEDHVHDHIHHHQHHHHHHHRHHTPSPAPHPHPHTHAASASIDSLVSGNRSRAQSVISKLGSRLSLRHPREILASADTVVRLRNGSVLSRGTLLKSDHFDTGFHTRIDFYLHGAPNFRMADMNIFGVAQPKISGISTVLRLLSCYPGTPESTPCIWFSTREEPMIYINQSPFVLRECDNPMRNVRTYQGISASRLENMEERLKEDILAEAARSNGLILVHDEIHTGKIVPTWMSVDSVQTLREVFQSFVAEGYPVKFLRIPVSSDQAPEDQYIDEYVNVIKSASINDSLVFNCGMGVGRTTFAMVVAMLIRRAQIMAKGLDDPVPINYFHLNEGSQSELWNMEENEVQNRALLKLVQVLEISLGGKVKNRSAIEWALARGPLIDDLKNAIMGNYQCILQLCSVLQDGNDSKKLLDAIIDRCDIMINLREAILMHRIRYSNIGDEVSLEKSLGCLEKYFFLLAFCSYVNESCSGELSSFGSWLKDRPEIWRMLQNIRHRGPRLYLFRPVEDLSVFAEEKDTLMGWGQGPARKNINELETYVIKSRQGIVLVPHTILKVDFWSAKASLQVEIEGASNFRKIPGLSIYGVAQPTLKGIRNVINELTKEHPPDTVVYWINLREEPLIYINGTPYVLRDQYFTLRNIKSYAGITSTRLELIEDRLKEDVAFELSNYDSRILLHREISDSKVTGIWEDCTMEHVLTIREIMGQLNNDGALKISYYRVPTTAEAPPDEEDFDTLLGILAAANLKSTAIVLNCQIGMGRSTVGTVLVSVLTHWLNGTTPVPSPQQRPRLNYQIIHSLLRVIRNGLECKAVVDNIVDNCGACLNMRDSIESWRLKAESADSEEQRRQAVRKGLNNLKRYFMMIVFQSYLDQHSPDMKDRLEGFSQWLSRHPEFKTMREELHNADEKCLMPVEKLEPGDGIALTNEVMEVVNQRNGSVLAQHTILKYDMFPGAQKLSLTERIEGAPNYRRVPLSSFETWRVGPLSQHSLSSKSSSLLDSSSEAHLLSDYPSVYGIGMPTKDAIRSVLAKVGAGPDGERRLLWTSLREEPVIYVNGRPYVLRLFQDPLKNLEATGIARERVERMEMRMKFDIISELRKYQGRLLLHEEEMLKDGLSIVPIWESVREEDVQTPLEIYKSIQEEGYRVDYLRIPITDEQAPIPDVFNQLVDRVLKVDTACDKMFNCQMGRGRTTTGMVITCIMEMVVGNPALIESQHTLDASDEPELLAGEADNRTRYQKGEYRVILQLIQVLQYGKLAKKVTDQAIDTCEHLQNLRIAIFDYKLRVEAIEVGTKKHSSLMSVALNYLIRYFYLIVFADYLLEEMSTHQWGSAWRRRIRSHKEPTAPEHEHRPLQPKKMFSEWLKDRREIANIVSQANQSLD
ncbi:inositol hexakisphosphate-domain-containing protein [Polychytrium aggregatum]|uniref:inositol hexakisphosphate-domain-containing protein n=1 Tax=Polychytrium aggregatum TaxID=110093 RepID=UPI0022FE23D7|nr:inositol hexakisphosphate-domain-containing protein [Polychytrium aggregatum]KAI9192964.1 inositol hexakisphosphate-domain-containing protein [Polychytrium aggregatum]